MSQTLIHCVIYSTVPDKNSLVVQVRSIVDLARCAVQLRLRDHVVHVMQPRNSHAVDSNYERAFRTVVRDCEQPEEVSIIAQNLHA